MALLTLDLNGDMADVVLFLDVPNDLVKHLISVRILLDGHMARQEHLPHRDSPDVQLMDSNHAFHLKEAALEPGGVDLAGRALHQNLEQVPNHPDCGEQHDHGEDEGAYEVDDLPLGLVPDESPSDHHADALDGVTDHMQISTVYIDVTAARLLSRLEQRFLGIILMLSGG